MAVGSGPDTTPSKPPVWNDPRYRSLFFQAAPLILVIGFFLYIGNNTAENLERPHIA